MRLPRAPGGTASVDDAAVMAAHQAGEGHAAVGTDPRGAGRRELGADSRVIFLSAYREEIANRTARIDPDPIVLEKPVHPKPLVSTVGGRWARRTSVGTS